jgi:hypothetical protein
MDPDPGGPKTYRSDESGFGSGSTTLAEINTIYQRSLLLQCCATKFSKVGQLKKTEVKPITRKLKRNYRNTKQCLLPPRDWAPVIKSSTPDFTPKIIYKFL